MTDERVDLDREAADREQLRKWWEQRDVQQGSYPFKTAAARYGVSYGEVLRMDALMPEMSGHAIDAPVIRAVLLARSWEEQRRGRIG